MKYLLIIFFSFTTTISLAQGNRDKYVEVSKPKTRIIKFKYLRKESNLKSKAKPQKTNYNISTMEESLRVADIDFENGKYTLAFIGYNNYIEFLDAEQLARVGYLYQLGIISYEQKCKSIEFYNKAIKLGSPLAMNNLGTMYLGAECDLKYEFQEAFRLFKQAANLGNIEAQANLGNLYYMGYGVEVDFYKAYYWYDKSANLGNAKAQCGLGSMYEEGEVVNKNIDSAIFWYKKSALQNNAKAQFNLGLLYCEGKKVYVDFKEAVYYFEKSSINGNVDAKACLGLMYEGGYGVLKDMKKATELLKDAAELGSFYAIGACERLKINYKPIDLFDNTQKK